MKVLDDTITKEIEKSEKRGDWVLCLALLELKQFRLEKRFNGMVKLDNEGVAKKYFETLINFK